MINSTDQRKFSLRNVFGNLLLSKHFQIERLHFVSGPCGTAQKDQARFDARVVFKAIDIDLKSQVLPTVVLDEFL